MSPSVYAIEWTSSALRSLDGLPPKIARACIEFVHGGLAQSPHRVGKALRFELTGKYSARRGDFRIIYAIDDEARVVTVIALGHRGDIYRRR